MALRGVLALSGQGRRSAITSFLRCAVRHVTTAFPGSDPPVRGDCPRFFSCVCGPALVCLVGDAEDYLPRFIETHVVHLGNRLDRLGVNPQAIVTFGRIAFCGPRCSHRQDDLERSSQRCPLSARQDNLSRPMAKAHPATTTWQPYLAIAMAAYAFTPRAPPLIAGMNLTLLTDMPWPGSLRIGLDPERPGCTRRSRGKRIRDSWLRSL